jgi:hypothetical protein
MSEEIRIDGNNEALKHEIESNAKVITHDLLEAPLLLPNMMAENACFNFIVNQIDKREDNSDIAIYLPQQFSGGMEGRIERGARRGYMREITDLPLVPIETNKAIYFLTISDSPRHNEEFHKLMQMYTGITEPKWISCFSSVKREDIISPYKFPGTVYAENEADPKKLDKYSLFVDVGQQLLARGFKNIDHFKFLFWQMKLLPLTEELKKKDLEKLLIEG